VRSVGGITAFQDAQDHVEHSRKMVDARVLVTLDGRREQLARNLRVDLASDSAERSGLPRASPAGWLSTWSSHESFRVQLDAHARPLRGQIDGVKFALVQPLTTDANTTVVFRFNQVFDDLVAAGAGHS
jgi:hypothetical protein